MPVAFAVHLRQCTSCEVETAFEQPDCADGHDDCPEWVCIGCGSALIVGFELVDPAEPAVSRVA